MNLRNLVVNSSFNMSPPNVASASLDTLIQNRRTTCKKKNKTMPSAAKKLEGVRGNYYFCKMNRRNFEQEGIWQKTHPSA